MKRGKKRILFAAVDIGWRIEHYTKFISEHLSGQLEAESFSKYVLPETHYKTNYTYTCPINKTSPIFLYLYSFCFFIFSLFRYDIFHFFSGETILTRKLRRFELITYKLFGKRVVMHFVGSDIRSEEYIYWKEQHITEFLNGKDDFPKSKTWQMKLIGDAEKYADCILVSTPDLKYLIPKALYYPVMLDLEKYLKELAESKSSEKKEDIITILHSPSGVKKNRLKGSNHIIKILNKIAATNQFNLKFILPSTIEKKRLTNYSATRYEMFEYFKEADIIIDQLIIGWYGLLSVEGVAAGKQVISYVDENLKPFLFPDSPILIADVNTLESTIIKCIENILNGKRKVATYQVEWIKKNHTIECNNLALLKAWDVSKSI